VKRIFPSDLNRPFSANIETDPAELEPTATA